MPRNPIYISYQDHSQHTTSYGTYINQPGAIHVSGQATAHVYPRNPLGQLDDLDRLNPVSSAGISALDQDGCMVGTRISLLNDLQQWSEDVTAHRIFWLDGMAGTGKSAIARSFSRSLHQNQRLGGSFFCTRAHESRANVKRILPTLAWSLARQDVHYRESLLRMVQDAPDVVDYSIERQFEFLFENPFRNGSLNQDSTQRTGPHLVLVIDALDECADSAAVTQLLKKLLSIADNLPIRFFLTSRPERHIIPHFKSPQSRILCQCLHDIEQEIVHDDISLYLKNRLGGIRSSNEDSSMFPDDWPLPRDVEILTRRADKLFIYAFTAVEYIRDEHPVDRLQTLTGLAMVAGQPFHGYLDNMYSLVLSAALDVKKRREEEICMTKRILGVVFTLREPLCLSNLAILLGVQTHVIRGNIDRIHAVISVPPPEKDGIVSVFHASFVDFLTTPGRAPDEMRITLSAAHLDLADRCLHIMDSNLHFNMAEVERKAVPEPLLYSCKFWFQHLQPDDVAVEDDPDIPLLTKFLQEHFYHWLEVMSLSDEMRNAILGLRRLTSLHFPDSTMTQLIKELMQFTQTFGYPISQSALHIYMSAIPFIPENSKMRSFLAHPPQSQLPQVIKPLNNWTTGVQILNGHTSGVTSVGFSPDGTKIVSGSNDKTIRIWEVGSGMSIVKPLTGHTNWVASVGFSPDVKKIVSSSYDKTIRIWNTESGESIIGPLTGHTSFVTSVGFSPDGKTIVSGSHDKTIRMWDVESGNSIVGPLTGHTSVVASVGFSPDGKTIVSGSHDKSIRIWDAESGMSIVGPLTGHTDWVTSVRFSPDGKKIMSGSRDHTLRIWDAESEMSIVGPLTGHTSFVTSIGFSPDGTKIVSGSNDRTIRIWDSESGKTIVGPLTGHTSFVTSVGFSPDGKKVVSGSYDNSIRIWDADSGMSMVGPSTGHKLPITSVRFSPDGMKIVSGSYDETIRIWDSESGKSIVGPLIGHTHWISFVAFTPDGKKIVSGSYDNTIRIWDAETGMSIVKPLTGHTDSVRSVGFSPDGKKIVSGCADKTIRIWDAESGMTIIKPLTGHTDWVITVGFSPDGKKIVSGSNDKSIRIWDAESGMTIVGPLTGHMDSVGSVEFLPDGKKIVSSSRDKSIRIWDAESGMDITQSQDLGNDTFVGVRSNTLAELSADGWLCDASGFKLLWIPNEMRRAGAAALWRRRAVWFNDDGCPCIADRLHLG